MMRIVLQMFSRQCEEIASLGLDTDWEEHSVLPDHRSQWRRL